VMMARHPDLSIVIDHVAKPHLRKGISDAFWDDMAALARSPQCVCKLSGLLTEAPKGAGIEVFKPVFKKLHALFGSERLLWGSDWPVLTLAASYDDWFALAHKLTAHLKSSEREMIFGGNAKEVYLRGRGRG
jgi:L-fuconolactonase